MQGTIISFENNVGLISGYDGKQYKFVRLDWKKEDQLPKINMEVNFDIEGEEAKNISLLRDPSARSKIALAAWCFFLGGTGVHRFLVGKIGTGLLMLFMPIIVGFIVGTLGSRFPSLSLMLLPGIIWIAFDFIMIITGNFTDKKGNKIT